jgi:glycosyltransferase involved in cell wall biosynthesis
MNATRQACGQPLGSAPVLQRVHGKKVLHVVGDSRYGGGSVLIIRMATAAKRVGWRVSVLASDELFAAELRQNGIDVITEPIVRRALNPLRDAIDTLRLVGVLRREGFDIVHTHTSKGGFIGRLAAKLARTPSTLHTVHGFAFHDFSGAAARLAFINAERLAAAWCDTIVTVSKHHRDVAIESRICPASKLLAIPNGIAAPSPQQHPRDPARSELGVAEHHRLVVSIGRLAAQKGLTYLIHAAALLRHRFPSLRFVVAGDGPDRAELAALRDRLGLQEIVHLIGFRREVWSLLAAADIVALPSLWEGLSISLLEAMAANKPIVATNIPSNVEVTEGGRCAVLVAPQSAPSLAAGIERLHESPEYASSLARDARFRFESFYTEERMLESYLKVYDDLVTVKKSAWN